MPMATLSVSEAPSPESPPTATPAEKKANTGTATPGRQRPDAVLEVLGQPGSGVRPAGRVAAHDGHGEREQHAGDRGVHPGLVHEHPGERGERQQQPPRPDALLHEQAEHARAGTSVSSRKPTDSSSV